ncbi:MAG TPA: 4-alpha-glucanotransferase, partial [Methylomirabilota bacterium]|nr:4-alpha-glucanotransferase [Methylomirabilota bacterium]
ARAKRELMSEVQQVCFAQFLLFRQGQRLMRYGREKGVRLIGDLPFFVSPDSSDVWANPEVFLLDEHHHPTFVVGVPPDYFSSEGQLWGNPVYNWEVLRQSGYRWSINRLRAVLAFVDVIRLDHFRGFSAAWHVPAGSTTAKSGKWVPGPSADFFNAVKKELGGLRFSPGQRLLNRGWLIHCCSLEGKMAKVIAWYDNEWGYSCRVGDLAALIAERA